MRREDVFELEEMNFNAWPALKTVHYDGWLLRCTGGASRRPNSANCIAQGTLDLNEKITHAESCYARWGQRAIFRITPLADDGLDAALERRGYEIEEPTFVQVAPTQSFGDHPEVRVFHHASDAWIEAALAVRGLTGGEAQTFAEQHRAVATGSVWALAEVDAKPATVGVASLERGWSGLHGIYVSKSARRLGLARKISEALLGVSHTLGASRAWLQVAQANAQALPLYRSLGFQTVYRYHHRVREARGVTGIA